MINLSKKEEVIVMLITLMAFIGMMLGVAAKDFATAVICMIVGLIGDYVLLDQDHE